MVRVRLRVVVLHRVVRASLARACIVTSHRQVNGHKLVACYFVHLRVTLEREFVREVVDYESACL